MKESNPNIEEMQNYLVDEIQNKKYDTEKFSEYMSKLKENGTDLNNWTFQEIKQAVSSFINQENSENLNNNKENVEKEVENVRNSFVLSSEEQNEKLNNHSNSFNNNNPYDKIFNDKDDNLKNVKNIMSDLSKEENNKINKVNNIPGFEDYEIIDTSEFIDSSSDKLECIKQRNNSLTDHDNLYVEILK